MAGEIEIGGNKKSVEIHIEKDYANSAKYYAELAKSYFENADYATQEEVDEVENRVEALENFNPAPQSGFTGAAFAVWSGEGLVYNYNFSPRYIEGELYPAISGSITLTEADATNPRFSTIIADVDGVNEIVGTPSENPGTPSLDPNTQLFVINVLINAGATTPAGTSNNIIYNEGTEASALVTTIPGASFTNTSDPYRDTYCIDAPAFTKGGGNKSLYFTLPDPFLVTDGTAMRLFIKFKGMSLKNEKISFIFYKGDFSTPASNFISILRPNSSSYASDKYNIDFGDTTNYQMLVIPFEDFLFKKDSFDRFEIRCEAAYAGFKIDYITIISSNGGVGGQVSSKKGIKTIITNNGIKTVETPEASVVMKGIDGLSTYVNEAGEIEVSGQGLSTRIDQYENYGEKVFKQAWINVAGTGVVADLDLSATASLSLNLTGTISELQSVFYDSLVEPPYTGSLGFIKNSQAIDVLIPHNELSSLVGRFTFKHPTEKDLVLKPGQVLALKTNGIADGYWEIVGLFLDETNLMNLTDDQDVDGNKNFLQPVSGPTATADEHFVPKAQMDAANAGTLASANAYTDSKVSGTYIFKGNKSNLADIIATGEQVNGYVYNALDTEKNYAWNGSAWDDIGGTFDISGKEDSSNKSNDIEADKASTVKYGNVAAWITWLKNSFVSNLPAKATALVDADLILTGDSEDSFKTKTRTWAQIKATLLAYFETIFAPKSITVVPISSNTTLDDTYNGKVVLLTASCTVTLPNGLATKFGVTIATKAGATLTLAVGGSVTLLNNVGTTMAEKLSCTLLNTGTANEYLTAGNL